jgi:hypothetical protein
MNSPSRRHYLLAAALLALSSCVPLESREDTITRSWPAAGIHRLNLSEVDGSLSVEAGSPDEVTMVAHVRTRGFKPKANRDNKGYFETRLSGDTLSIGRRQHGMHIRLPFMVGDNITVDYTLRVPPQIVLDLRTVNGRIAMHGVDGGTAATTVNGAIDIDAPGANEIEAKTVNGHVRARFLQTFQGARLKTVNGSVEASMPAGASFACNLSQVNGDFEAAFPLSIHSHPGSRRVSGEINGGRYELTIVTVNGDVHIDSVRLPVAPPAPPASPQAPPAPAVPSAPSAPTAPPAPVT